MVTNEVVDGRREPKAVLDGWLATDKVAVRLWEGIRISFGSSGRWLCVHFAEFVAFFHCLTLL